MGTSSEEVNLYEILGISSDASIEQIRSAYRKQALKHHPDKGGSIEMFTKLSKAYQILSDPNLRSQYDKAQPLPEFTLIPPLNVFADCFNHWLKQYPLLETLFKDNCGDVIKFLSTYHEHPLMKVVIGTLTGVEVNSKETSGNKISRIIKICLDDLFSGKKYQYQLNLFNKDLSLSDDYRIEPNVVPISIPIEYNEINATINLSVTNQETGTITKQEATAHLTVEVQTNSHFHRIRDYDIFTYVDVTREQLIHQDVIEFTYLKNKVIRIKNPKNQDLRQLYQISKLGLPNRKLKERGQLYILFNLCIDPPVIVNHSTTLTPTAGTIYECVPVDLTNILA